ncbi:LLM class flavin-dependent oxidoreductase, partial [Cellulomonas sp.]|uniref:LLM class flavin-dependent oxidoreductase n=1 Tax=Cellulomonas sp. TaxID=40001 RepID=UPI002D2A58D2
MPVEFLGIATTNDASETRAATTRAFDPGYLERIVRAHEDTGWTRVLFAYGSSGPEPAALAAYVASRLPSIELLLAHRPNVSYPTYAAKTFATLDQLSGGRLSVHFITGGNDHEQGREGDTLTKDERYARTREYIQIVKRAWTSTEPFDHHGRFYDFADFHLDTKPVDGHVPTISFGGSSDAAFEVGAAEADIYAVWGEPLDRT